MPSFEEAQRAGQQAYDMAAQSAKLPDMLREAVSERFKSSPIYGEREKAAEQVLTSPTRAREYVTNLGQTGQAILSPTQQESIIAARRAADVVPLMSLNDILNMRTGTTEQAISEGMNAWNTLLGAQQRRAGDLYTQASDEWQRSLQEQQFAEQQRQFDLDYALSQQKLSQSSGGGITGQNVNSLKSDVQSGKTLDDVMRKYSGTLDTNDILQLYNISSPYGAAKESSRELERRYGIKPSKTALEDQSVTDVMRGMEDLKSASVSSPVSIYKYMNQKAMVGQWLARLVETGRLSDQDRIFYQKQLPSWPIMMIAPDQAKEVIDGVVNNLKTKVGMSGQEMPSLDSFWEQ